MANHSDTKNINVGNVFEMLCRRIAQYIVENDTARLKKVKSIITNNLFVSEELSKELNLYNTIAENKFKDRSVAKAFLGEVINHAKALDQTKISKQIKGLLEQYKTALSVAEQPKPNELYSVLNEVFIYNRQKQHTLEESKRYYKNLEFLLSHLTYTEEPIVEEKKPQRINKLVYNCAVKRLNETYSTLTESQKEIIGDFLMHRSSDRFKKSLLKRMKNISEQLSGLKKYKNVQQIDALQKKINEYHKYASSSNEPLNNMMLNVCEITDLYEEVKKYCNESSSK